MIYLPLRFWAVFATLLLVTAAAVPVYAQADWSAKVLAQKDLDQKEFLVCISGNKGVPAKTLRKLISRERHGPAVAAAAGMYLELGELDQDTPGLIRLLAQRPDISSQSITYAALSPRATDLIVGFSSSKSKSDQQIAARMLAATAVMRAASDRKALRLADKVLGSKNNRLDVNYRAEIEKLLNVTKDEVTKEYLLFAVGMDRIVAVKDAITPHAKSKDQ
ncbi:MAG: hypothetical protein AB8C95_10600, partial [Phycisphaeraceae bacterium]